MILVYNAGFGRVNKGWAEQGQGWNRVEVFREDWVSGLEPGAESEGHRETAA